ncbi:MAG: hypothetical protein HZA60_00910 [Deltaproteobacteria bacterium]|nr:hypothetical protein [Deltaproteobacteria bacterium]
MALSAAETFGNLAKNSRLQNALIALFFLGISALFFNKIFTSDYGIHLSIGKHFIETGKVPDKEFMNYPLLNQPMNYEELGFQAILYTVYRVVGSDGVSVFVWLMATLSFFFIYKSLRARDINPYIALFTMLIFAMPFRIRLQPRPEIIAYFFTSYLIYGCSLFYYKGNRKILYTFPLVFLLWANIHPSTLAGIGAVGAFGTQSLVVIYRDKFAKASLKNNLFVPLGIFVLCVLATFLSKHGVESVLTPVRLMVNPNQMTGISEMTSVKNSGFYEFYKYILAVSVVFGALGLIAWKLKIHDIIMAVYGLKLPLQVARGMAFMSVFAIPMVAQSFDGFLRRIRTYLSRREEASLKAGMKAVKEKEPSRKKQGKKVHPAAEQKPTPASPAPLPALRYFRLPIVLAWLVFLGATGYGAYYIRVGTADIVENGIGLTEHKFSLKSGEFLRNLDIKGNMFNFFDLGGFVEWQVYPRKLTFIDGRAGNPTLFMEHQAITSGMGDMESTFRKYNITYVITKTVDSAGMVLPLINYLAMSPSWELVFADGLAVVFVKNIPENRAIIDRYKISKNVLGAQIVSEMLHSTYLGINRFFVYYTIGNIYMNSGDYGNARKFFELARSIHDDPNLAALVSRLDGMQRMR